MLAVDPLRSRGFTFTFIWSMFLEILVGSVVLVRSCLTSCKSFQGQCF